MGIPAKLIVVGWSRRLQHRGPDRRGDDGRGGFDTAAPAVMSDFIPAARRREQDEADEAA